MIGIALVLALAQSAAPRPDIDEVQAPALKAASDAVLARQPQRALDAIEPAITAYEAANAGDKRRLYCGMSMTETLLYMTMASSEKQDAVALHPGYCTALYLKGYALVDLGRLPEGRAVYLRLTALAPMHAHFLTELGQSYRPDKDWGKMLETCRRAESALGLVEKDQLDREKLFAWHCLGYALSEQGKLDAVEALYRKCLAIDPKDVLALNELQWLAGQRGKPN